MLASPSGDKPANSSAYRVRGQSLFISGDASPSVPHSFSSDRSQSFPLHLSRLRASVSRELSAPFSPPRHPHDVPLHFPLVSLSFSSHFPSSCMFPAPSRFSSQPRVGSFFSECEGRCSKCKLGFVVLFFISGGGGFFVIYFLYLC